jgi:hypothetical protein
MATPLDAAERFFWHLAHDHDTHLTPHSVTRAATQSAIDRCWEAWMETSGPPMTMLTPTVPKPIVQMLINSIYLPQHSPPNSQSVFTSALEETLEDLANSLVTPLNSRSS